MPSIDIHRNDTVKVLTGADRGKTQRVLRVFPEKGTVLVDPDLERGSGVPQLRSGSCGPQGGRHNADPRVQEVRAVVAHQEVASQ
jgi:hypothetical protein